MTAANANITPQTPDVPSSQPSSDAPLSDRESAIRAYAARRPQENKLQQTLRNPFVLMGAAIVVAFILFVIILNPFNNPYGKGMDIVSLDQCAPGLATPVRQAASSMLLKIVEQSGVEESIALTAKAIPREDTCKFQYNEKVDITYGTFIVDIPDLAQTYLLSYEWAKDMKNPNLSSTFADISCPKKKEIPDNYSCYTSGGTYDTSPATVLASNTPFRGVLDDGKIYFIRYRTYADGTAYAEVSANVCKSATGTKELEAAYSAWLESVDLEPDDLPHEIRILCDGGV